MRRIWTDQPLTEEQYDVAVKGVARRSEELGKLREGDVDESLWLMFEIEALRELLKNQIGLQAS